MSIFTTKELDYLSHQRLGRLATVDSDGNPHVVPVGFRHNLETDTIDIGGHDIAQSKKWRDVGRHPRVAFVVDDVLPPWQPRSVAVFEVNLASTHSTSLQSRLRGAATEG